MEKVTGIGGVFFRSNNPSKLSEWYEKYLGVPQIPTSNEQDPWVQESGPTVFAPFESDTEYFGAPSQSWMINFRVNDLSKIVEQLREEGIEVHLDNEDHSTGRFARLNDPDGNPIELWEPAK